MTDLLKTFSLDDLETFARFVAGLQRTVATWGASVLLQRIASCLA
jgi:hypothetical protein